MLQLDATWMDNISKRIWPTPLLVIKAGGNRVYSNRDVSDITASVFGPAEDPVISFENRVISFGQITKKVFDFTQTIVQGFNKKTLQIATVVLNNSDREVSVLVNRERWHNKTLEIYLAYADSTAKLKIFEGVIQDISYSLTRETATLRATESGYDQVFRPLRASDLNSSAFEDGGPDNPKEIIPIIYGEMDSTSETLPFIGAWKMPLIRSTTIRKKYCYAGHECLSIAAGNAPRVWIDNEAGSETTGFVFNGSDTSFDIKPISTIELVATTGFKLDVTVRGMGKPTSAASTTLMENLVDIITDFIQVENGSVFQIDPTNSIDSKTFLESTNFTATPPGKSAGIITQEIPVWTQIQEMLSGLGGTAFLSSDDGKLKFVIDEFIKIPDNSLIISRGDILDSQTMARVKNVYNSIGNKYAWFETLEDYVVDGGVVSQTTSINHYAARDLILTTKWSFTGHDVSFLKGTGSGFRNNVSRPLDIITCTIANPVIMQIEPGLDYLYLTFENLIGTDGKMKINEFCKVLSIKFLLDQDKAELTVMDTNQWKDDGAGSRDMTLY